MNFIKTPSNSVLTPYISFTLQIRGMGMNSPELLLLVENCPKGAETLVTRCLHILTDKGTTASCFTHRFRKRLLAAIYIIGLLSSFHFQSLHLQTWWSEYGISITNECQMCVSSSRLSTGWKRSLHHVSLQNQPVLLDTLVLAVLVFKQHFSLLNRKRWSRHCRNSSSSIPSLSRRSLIVCLARNTVRTHYN